MSHSGKVDQDDIVRARNVLLASGRRTPREEVDAYRVLARVSPAAYLPLLAKALQRLSYDTGSGKWHASSLALCEEAVAVARSMDPAQPARADVLYEALNSCQRELYTVGRRAEGLALRAEMLAIGRAQAELSGNPVVNGLHVWAAGLSEEGRYAEAADAMTEVVAAILPHGPSSGGLAWSLLDEQAVLVWREALALLTELADTGERKSWGGYEASFWAVLLTMSGAESDRPASDGPRPPSGAAPIQWSPDAKRHYFDSRHALREEVDALAARATEDPDRHLAELVRLHRVLTIRSTVYWQNRTHLFAEQVRSLFDDGVSLARRLSQHDPAEGKRALARILIDRSTFHTATCEFRPALDDFREALSYLGEADRGPSSRDRCRHELTDLERELPTR
ncbi:hypothetical protein [Streptomyces sp. NPDC057686]|uniref:hypothetical protein n=1 Tax=Streptomyces sp. NPDC057686 TaxID=3346212 RepID=UPI00368E3D6C